MAHALTYRGPALDTLHEDYAKRHRIDPAAPVQARVETAINAPVRAVWDKLSDVAAWRTNLEPDVKDIQLADGVAVGSHFNRTIRGARLRARFAVVDAERELAWSGISFGIKVVHRYLLSPLTPTQTRVIAEESMAGPPLAILFNSRRLGELLAGSLETLRRASES